MPAPSSCIQQARAEIAAEVEGVRSQLLGEIEALSSRIITSLTSRRAA